MRGCAHACPDRPLGVPVAGPGSRRFLPPPHRSHPPLLSCRCLRNPAQRGSAATLQGPSRARTPGVPFPGSGLTLLICTAGEPSRPCWLGRAGGWGEAAEDLLCPPRWGGLVAAKATHPAARSPTCSARVVGHREREPVLLGIHGEQAHAEAPVVGVGRAVVEVLQVHVQLVGRLRGQRVEPLEPWSRERTRAGGVGAWRATPRENPGERGAKLIVGDSKVTERGCLCLLLPPGPDSVLPPHNTQPTSSLPPSIPAPQPFLAHPGVSRGASLSPTTLTHGASLIL